LNRIDRLNAILIHLQSKKRVTAQQIADRFEISVRSVYRDVKALQESGVPVIGDAGIGYSVMDGYRLPPVMFTAEEGSALLIAGKFAERFTDPVMEKQFSNALFKIKSVLRGSDKDHIEQLEENVLVYSPKAQRGDAHANRYLYDLQYAVVQKKAIHIEYFTPYNEQRTERTVEPIGLCYYAQGWHCIGWCKLRGDYRDFKLSRMLRLTVTDTVFNNKRHPSIREYMDGISQKEQLHEVKILFRKEVVRYVQSEKYYQGFVSEEEAGEYIRMVFFNAYPDVMARWLLMFMDNIIIETSDKLKDLMIQHVHTLKTHYLE
jgi:predicted DNA-binding transcriptional regulator YafY